MKNKIENNGKRFSGKWLAFSCLFVASLILAIIPLAVNKANANKAIEDKRYQVTIQRDVIADYQTKVDQVGALVDSIRTKDFDNVDMQDEIVQQLLTQAQSAVNAFYNMANVLNSATYISDDTVAFLNSLQAQMDAAAFGDTGIQARASYTDNHTIYVKILFVNIPVGYHVSPSTCRVVAALAAVASEAANLISFILSETGLGSVVATIIGFIFSLVGTVFTLGADNKGCDVTYLPPLILPCF